MSPVAIHKYLVLAVIGGLLAGCNSTSTTTQAAEPAPPPLSVAAVAASEQPIARFIRATGSLTADEQADVAAETPGRVIGTPIERGTQVKAGQELIRLSPTENDAQVREAEANAAQIEARLGLAAQSTFDVNAVPEVQNANAAYKLAQSEFARIQSLLDQRVVSQSEFDQRSTQMEAMRQQVEVAKNTAAQQYQALQGARARITLARKTLADTVVRAPFSGVVAQRLVSVGDYVTKGMKVAVVVRVDPLRVELTVPEQFVSAMGTGQPVSFQVDAYPNRTFEGKVRFVSPSLETAQRALTVEAIVPNPGGELKPGLFASALIEQPTKTPGVLVPLASVQTTAGTSRVFVVNGDRVEERLVTVGQAVDQLVEITRGLKSGEKVATTNVPQLIDGQKVAS
jgi:RND family efflux transporter MFP subunit